MADHHDDAFDPAATSAAFRGFAATARQTAPLYAHLSLAVARDPKLAALLAAAPSTQRNPVLLFAAIHALLLRGDDHPLGRHYATLPDRGAPGRNTAVRDFTDFLATRRDDLAEIVADRSMQTNEVGRSAVLLPPVAATAEREGPVGLLDLGTSAGLNLLMDRWSHHWSTRAGEVVLAGEPGVQVTCDVTGPAWLPAEPPPVAWRLGIDRSPAHVDDPDDVAWLLACVWPDELERFERLRAAVEVAREDPPPVRRGDVVTDLVEVVAEVPDDLHPVATTSWVLNYLPVARQDTFVDLLDQVGRERDHTLVALESPHRTPGLPWPPGVAGLDVTVLATFRWRGGGRAETTTATAHPHGWWLDTTRQRRI
ncbi:DUF2332 domain-containing protein [Salsipaludibacter albus]|uniref:DUF2332 domain-containing protein n=1 Tax=Salsipaludibacter albus TaxID=2849650 RepID=UPI001EE4E5B7|nr:DUF2332 domain-containing protein [Salsipaludibacter albus]MBY5161531.1 DUF2332 domain-containing protein [Salsipaludibacter albus]